MKTTSVIMLLLIAFNIIFIVENFRTQDPHNRRVNTDHTLEPIDGDRPKTEGVITLYVFYHADEACGCLDDWKNWVSIYENYSPVVQVKGIFNGSNLEKFRTFNKEFNIPFTTYLDEGSHIRNRYMIPPNITAKVLVGPNGHVLISDVYEDNPRDQFFFLKRVKTHCDRILDNI